MFSFEHFSNANTKPHNIKIFTWKHTISATALAFSAYEIYLPNIRHFMLVNVTSKTVWVSCGIRRCFVSHFIRIHEMKE